ncbi:RNA polymerase I-specific transcription initiation factor RRN3-like [Mya arenaria]|uniref:RNA polymerase I-specific transcription initiation factor RRN3-like n=1 Tax=Mya arenaria TaxID=6604 RepID=UPI0022E18270|nr:RNA polymerase I-specific transcription initiation factor RRN3-like [Mya arenaria]
MGEKYDFCALLTKYNKGSRNGYDSFVSQLADRKIEDGILLKCLTSLQPCVTQLDKENHQALVSVLLRLNWCSKPPAVIEVYQSIIITLVSTHTDFLKPCLKMIISVFVPDLKKKDGKVAVNEEMTQSHSRAFIQAHTLLRAITQIVPMAASPGVLVPLLGELSPWQGRHVYEQECYVRNLIQATYYLPTLRQNIMEHIIHKMINYDIQAPRSKLVETISDDSQESGIFNMDETSSCHEAAEKLDIMMVLLYEYIKSVCFNNGELNWECTKRFYREMLYVFEKIILPTYACSHTQFVMFYLASLKTELCDGFLDYLWKRVQNPNVHSVYRQTAVTYMGSLLARAKFINIRTVMRTLELMMTWAHNYTQTCLDSVMADIKHHGPFYSVCQAVFYVFAFRQKEMFETRKGLKWAENLQIQHLIQSRLNPLKVCLPLIVKTFASICRQHQLAFCDHIIQQNARSFIPVVSDGTQKVLEAYFPFDPYLLDRSKHYIEDQYRTYDRCVDFEDEDSAEEEDDDEMFTEDVMSSKHVAMATAPGSYVDKSNVDLMSYGTSPGFIDMT